MKTESMPILSLFRENIAEAFMKLKWFNYYEDAEDKAKKISDYDLKQIAKRIEENYILSDFWDDLKLAVEEYYKDKIL